jgi:hypothetical protein
MLVAIAILIALLVAPAALAHVTVTPAFLASGESGTLRFEAPNELEDEPMTGLVLRLPAGLRVEPSDQPRTTGWELEAAGGRATWSGGSLPPLATQVFELSVSASGEPGAVVIAADLLYASGAEVSWKPGFTILPAAGDSPSQRPGRALVAGIVGVLIVAASLVVAHRLRRRPHQPEDARR